MKWRNDRRALSINWWDGHFADTMSSSSEFHDQRQEVFQVRESASAFTIPELLFIFEGVLETLHRLTNGGEIALLSDKHNEGQECGQI